MKCPPKDTRLYICGNPKMVLLPSKKIFLNGVSISNIYSDPFEYKDMRLNIKICGKNLVKILRTIRLNFPVCMFLLKNIE